MIAKENFPFHKSSPAGIKFTSILLLMLFMIAACKSPDSVNNGGDLPGDSLSEQPGTEEYAYDPAADQITNSADQTPEGLSAAISDINPCELLTIAEIEAALGESISSSDRSTVFNYESCDFQSQSGGKFIILQLTHQTAEQFKIDNEETSAMFEATLIPVENLGDDAAFYSGLLRVRVAETVLQIATWHTDEELDQALLLTQDLARIAITRLP